MSISALYILDESGRILISRDYRGDVPMEEIENFIFILNQLDVEDVTPVFNWNNISYIFLKENDLYIVCTVKKNANAMLIFTFLRNFVKILVQYFKQLEEESIQDNFVLIYELLDEVIDFGYPQITDSKILQEYITQKSHQLRKRITIPSVVTNAVHWRPEGVHYKKNEVFLDLVESVNIIMYPNGNILKNEVNGTVFMNVHLSGMPQLRLGFNEKLTLNKNLEGGGCLEDVKFHQCVQLSRFHNEKAIYFIPPDGNFELMSYRFSSNVSPLIFVEVLTEYFALSRIEYVVNLKSQFRRCSAASNVEVIVPVPSFVDSPVLKFSVGSARYSPENNALIWCMKSLPGAMEYSLKARFRLSSLDYQESERKVPLQVKFVIPYFTVSGIQIRYVKIIEKTNYKTLTWVRYTTKNGDYEIRVN